MNTLCLECCYRLFNLSLLWRSKQLTVQALEISLAEGGSRSSTGGRTGEVAAKKVLVRRGAGLGGVPGGGLGGVRG